MTVQKVTVTHRGMDGALAAFDLMLKIVREEGDNHVTIELFGKLLLDPKTSELASQTLDAP